MSSINKDNIINLIGTVVAVDGNNQKITISYNESLYKLQVNEVFKDSFDHIISLYRANDPIIQSTDINISLVNININQNEIEFSEKLGSYIILEPNWIINVTALTEFDFCERSLFNNRFSIRTQNEYMLMGSIIHEVFEDIMMGMNSPKEDLFKVLKKKLNNAIKTKIFDFALLDIDIDKLLPTIKEHLNALYLYIKNHKDYYHEKEILTEHYIIDTSLGLKGKIDSIIINSESMTAIELKTGKSWGGKVKSGHAFQAQAYSLLLENKYKNKTIKSPVIVYSGDHQYYNKDLTPFPELGIMTDFDYQAKAHVISLRNRLVVADFLFKLEYEKNNKKKCEKCFQASMCQTINHLEPIKDSSNEPLYAISANPFSQIDRTFFKEYNQYLTEECALIKYQIGDYFSKSIEEKIEMGKCLEINKFNLTKEKNIQVLCDNQSELREQDRCLISDEKGPVKGECLEAMVSSVEENSITLKVRRDLRFDPKWIDSIGSEVMFERNYPSLTKLLQTESLEFLKKILVNNEIPADNKLQDFKDIDTGFELNEVQNKAIQSALGLKQLLLIQGPPGTGKTITIAKIVREMHNQGKRILLSCFTHRAIDELIRKMAIHSPDVPFYRIGGFSLDEDINSYNIEYGSKEESNVKKGVEDIQRIINTRPVYIGTSQAWLSGKYDNLIGKDMYDVSIIDEASQMILPNSIGVIRHAKSSILVGDHFQQPPIIQSNKAKELSRTLFQILFENEELPENMKIMLDTQHRMNPVIGDFISEVFYDKKLNNSSILSQEKIYSTSDSHSMIGKICDPDDIITLVHSENVNHPIKNKSVEEDAEIILDIIEFLIKKGINPKDIGVIAPYRAQVALIRRKVENFISNNELNFSTKNMIDTIDRFQGDEREVIIFSMCISKEITSDLLKDKRKINVALSRAKKKLIVAGNWDLANDYKVFKSLFDYVEENKHSKFIRI